MLPRARRAVPASTLIALVVVGGLVTGCAGTQRAAPGAPTPATTPTAPAARGPVAAAVLTRNDYGKPEAWLCRPGRRDACTIDLTTTLITADGTLVREDWKANPDAPIDCFYVYPTVSQDPTPNSDMEPGPEERRAVELQLARFGSQCRLFAPVYRQLTLAGLLDAMKAKQAPDWSLAHADVLDAWNYYLQHDNRGRGVVLVGHSQGSFILMQLLRGAIEGKPIQKQIVSALIIGANLVAPPPGSDPAPRLPPCTYAMQTGCVISYVSFRTTSPPPPNALFGRGPGGAAITCTNPAALGGGRAELDAYFSTGRSLLGPKPFPWLKAGTPITTPFVRVPGLVTGECVSKDGATYLSVSVRGDRAGPRTPEIPGDTVHQGAVLPGWGLHLVDVNLAMGNLIDVVGQQARAYVARRER